jgi:hypothetical protein
VNNNQISLANGFGLNRGVGTSKMNKVKKQINNAVHRQPTLHDLPHTSCELRGSHCYTPMIFLRSTIKPRRTPHTT